MRLPVRILIALGLLVIIGFCSSRLQSTAYAALTGNWGLRVIYALTGSACLLGIVMLFLPKEEPKP